MSILRLIVGFLLLFYGRTLYWLFVALAGFLVGFELAAQLLADRAESVRILVALLGGLVGAILGIVAQRIAFAVGGLFTGGYLALVLTRTVENPGEPLVWFAVGATLGAIVAALLMDWAIIALSSLAGAATIVSVFSLSDAMATLLFVVLTVVGILIQGRRLRGVGAGPTAPSDTAQN
jgi:hypothetical protein